MSEDTATRAYAGREMVFRPSRAVTWFLTALWLIACYYMILGMLEKWPDPARMVVFVLSAIGMAFLLLGFWCSSVAVSEEGLAVTFGTKKQMIPARDLLSAGMTPDGDVKIVFENQGRIGRVRIGWTRASRSDRRRLFNAIRELWPGIITEYHTVS